MHTKHTNTIKSNAAKAVIDFTETLAGVRKVMEEAHNELQRVMSDAQADLIGALDTTTDARIYDGHTMREVIERLKEVAKTATMENANFDRLFDKKPEGITNETEYVKERTELWRNSWVVHPLEGIIKVLETAAIYDEQGRRNI